MQRDRQRDEGGGEREEGRGREGERERGGGGREERSTIQQLQRLLEHTQEKHYQSSTL